MILYHAANIYTTLNQRETERMGRAQRTWYQTYGASHGLVKPAHSKSYDRDGRTIGDNRAVPFIKDIIAVAEKMASPTDAIMLTNADSSLCQRASDWIMQGLFEHGCCFSSRRDMDKIHRTWLTQEQIMERGADFIGVDLVAFTMEWWQKNKDNYPDLLLGYEGWDWCFKFLMGEKTEIVPVVYHEMHQEPYWHQHRLTAKGNQYNRQLCLEWAQKRPDFDRLKTIWKSLPGYMDKARGVRNQFQKDPLPDGRQI